MALPGSHKYKPDYACTPKEQVEEFLNATGEARELSERDRDYYDHKQWTDAEIAKLKKRGQAPVVVNRVRPKIEGLKGLVSMRQTDPKAYPRTKKHEQASEAVTDGLRYVADSNNFPAIRLDVAEDFFIEGYAGAIVDVKQKKNGEIFVRIMQIPFDRIYFSVHSRKKDFSDSPVKGMLLWMSADEAETMFPDIDIRDLWRENAITGADGTFSDRPRWVDRKQNRVQIALHFSLEGGEWKMCIFCGDCMIKELDTSPFLDDDGEPSCPIELVSAYIDRDNNRFGEVRGFIWQQDEINHRRSKGLHLLSQRQTYGRKGEAKDIAAMKRELAKPDGHIEFTGQEFGKDFGVLPTGDMAKGQFELYQDAKNELDATSFNAQLSGERQGDLSGKAIGKLQTAGALEINSLFLALTDWEKRIYRQVWARIKQFWDKETWVRVTDDEDSLRWVGFNVGVTAQQWLEEMINDDSTPIIERKKAAAAYQAMIAQNSPALNEIVDVKNAPAKLDMDIILDQSFDTINVQEEQFQMLMQFGQGSNIDIIDLIEVSQIRNKKQLIEKIEKRREAAAQAAGNIQQLQADSVKAKTDKTVAETQKIQQEGMGKKIENVLTAVAAHNPLAIASPNKPAEAGSGAPDKTNGSTAMMAHFTGQMTNSLDNLAKAQALVAQALAKPKVITRDPETREIVGVQ